MSGPHVARPAHPEEDNTVLWKLLLTAFFMAHAAIHFGFISTAPAPAAGAPPWPFDLTRSWVLTPLGLEGSVTKTLGGGLLLLLGLGYAAATLVMMGVLPERLFSASIIVGTSASLLLLALFFHPWLVLGVAIDVVLLYLVLGTSWAPLRA
jgi:hypothetical protein